MPNDSWILLQQALIHVHAAMESSEVYQTMRRHLDEQFGIRQFSVFLFNNETDQYNLDFSTHVNADEWDIIFFQRDEVPFEYFDGQPPLYLPSTLTWFGYEFPLYWVSRLSFRGEVAVAFVSHEFIEDFESCREQLELYLNHVGLALIKTRLYEQMCDSREAHAAKLEALNEMGEVLSSLDLDRILARLMELSLKIMDAEVGAILLRGEEGQLEPTIEWGLQERHIIALVNREERRFVDLVMENAAMLIIDDLAHDEEYENRDRQYNISSVIGLPLLTKEAPYGVLVVVNPEADLGETCREVETLRTVAHLASITIENFLYHRQVVSQEKLMGQLRVAGEIQRGLLPAMTPNNSGYDISGISIPATNVGGDFFDYLTISPGELCVVIGDVAGKGLPAALLMAMTRSMIRASLRLPEAPLDDRHKLQITALNTLISQENLNDRFITALFAWLHREAGTLTVVSAGHNPLLLFRRQSGVVESLNEGGLPLGIVAHEDYAEQTVAVAPDDILLMYTDGIPDARNHNEVSYGVNRLQQVVWAYANQSATMIRDAILTDVERFTGPQPENDDMTVVVIKIEAH